MTKAEHNLLKELDGKIDALALKVVALETTITHFKDHKGWLNGIVSGIISAVVAGIVLFWLK